jgi:hypothetical protein
MHPLTWLGVILLVAWALLWLGFKIVSGMVHLIVLVALALIVWGLVKRGASAVGKRM